MSSFFHFYIEVLFGPSRLDKLRVHHKNCRNKGMETEQEVTLLATVNHQAKQTHRLGLNCLSLREKKKTTVTQ